LEVDAYRELLDGLTAALAERDSVPLAEALDRAVDVSEQGQEIAESLASSGSDEQVAAVYEGLGALIASLVEKVPEPQRDLFDSIANFWLAAAKSSEQPAPPGLSELSDPSPAPDAQIVVSPSADSAFGEPRRMQPHSAVESVSARRTSFDARTTRSDVSITSEMARMEPTAGSVASASSYFAATDGPNEQSGDVGRVDEDNPTGGLDGGKRTSDT
jgi:hypothetical protein